ncbi:hypothetical protein M885DRAFT_626306 [Pelagophyceae sp. CCMP2097]|nr:hypothetical protein M885DRAFT_626306 [Pelagophyceae sp. CCMP2097]
MHRLDPLVPMASDGIVADPALDVDRPANHQINVSSAAISAVDDLINTYYCAAQNVEPASACETDPLATPRLRRKRARQMRGLAPFERLEDEYIAMRRITRKLRPPADGRADGGTDGRAHRGATATPSAVPSAVPTVMLTPAPTVQPTTELTAAPTAVPTAAGP